jgi:hypothetical protein
LHEKGQKAVWMIRFAAISIISLVIVTAPTTSNKNKPKVSFAQVQPIFKKLIDLKNNLDTVMYNAVDELKEKSPKTADIYARTKTPYSILKKLVDNVVKVDIWLMDSTTHCSLNTLLALPIVVLK